jgi:hypothetical protein
MNHNAHTLDSFKAILPFIDWKIQCQPTNLPARAVDRTSINYVADCYIALPPKDMPAALKLIHKNLPKSWNGWPMVLLAARKRRLAFASAILLGILSANPQDAHYFGNYFYVYRENGSDVFKHYTSFKLLIAPSSKSEIEKYQAKRKFEYLQ